MGLKFGFLWSRKAHKTSLSAQLEEEGESFWLLPFGNIKGPPEVPHTSCPSDSRTCTAVVCPCNERFPTRAFKTLLPPPHLSWQISTRSHPSPPPCLPRPSITVRTHRNTQPAAAVSSRQNLTLVQGFLRIQMLTAIPLPVFSSFDLAMFSLSFFLTKGVLWEMKFIWMKVWNCRLELIFSPFFCCHVLYFHVSHLIFSFLWEIFWEIFPTGYLVLVKSSSNLRRL